MNAVEFEKRRLLVAMDGRTRTVQAARLMLVDGFTLSEASRQVGVSVSVVSRGAARLKAAKLQEITCPNCGHRFIS